MGGFRVAEQCEKNGQTVLPETLHVKSSNSESLNNQIELTYDDQYKGISVFGVRYALDTTYVAIDLGDVTRTKVLSDGRRIRQKYRADRDAQSVQKWMWTCQGFFCQPQRLAFHGFIQMTGESLHLGIRYPSENTSWSCHYRRKQ